MFGPLLDVQMSFRVAGARDCAPGQKWAKPEGFVAFPKMMAGVGTFEEDLQRCIFCGRRSTRDMFIRAVRRSGRWFPERGSLAELFRFWCCQLRKFRKSRRIVSFFVLSSSKLEEVSQTCFFFDVVKSSSKIEEVSQNSFVLDVAKFKNWGSLAELLHFQACS